MTKKEMKEYITLDKSAFDDVMELIFEKGSLLKCSFCKEDITKDNFGLVSKGVISCNGMVCVLDAVKRFEENIKVWRLEEKMDKQLEEFRKVHQCARNEDCVVETTLEIVCKIVEEELINHKKDRNCGEFCYTAETINTILKRLK